MALGKSDREVIENVIKALRGEGSASPEIKEMLSNWRMRSWLDTWVVGALEILVDDNRTKRDLDLAVRLSR